MSLYLGDVAAAAAATTEDCMVRATLLFLPAAAPRVTLKVNKVESKQTADIKQTAES